MFAPGELYSCWVNTMGQFVWILKRPPNEGPIHFWKVCREQEGGSWTRRGDNVTYRAPEDSL